MSSDRLYDRTAPALSGVERELFDAVSESEPAALLDAFSDLVRTSGTADERAAADYITGRLDALGVPFDRYDPELYVSRPRDARLAIAGGDRPTLGTAKTVAFSADTAVSGEAVHVEPDASDVAELSGSFDVGLRPEDLDVDVAGRIVVVEAILPIEAINAFAAAGAAGFVCVHPHPDEPHEGIVSPVWGAVPDPQRPETNPDIAVATVSRTDGDVLLEALDADPALTLELETDVWTGWAACPVIVAEIPGAAAPEEEDFVLLHGHYDSWHEGITDNATGDAGLLECARVFNEHRDELRRDLRVAWWPAHSTGRYAGSAWYVDAFAHELEDRCLAHVNMDSPGVAGATEFESRVKWMPELREVTRAAIEDVAGKPAGDGRPPRAGDYSFNNLGIPGASIQSSVPPEVREERGYHAVGGSGGRADAWHLSTDTLEKADLEVLVRDVRVFTVAVFRLLAEPVVPLDHGRTVERHLATVDRYTERVGEDFDLEPVRARLERLDRRLERFEEAVEAGRIDADRATAIKGRLSRLLTRVDFTSRGRYEQDPALYRPPYPRLAPALELGALEGDAYRFQITHLRRARNWIVDRLEAAIDAVPATAG